MSICSKISIAIDSQDRDTVWPFIQKVSDAVSPPDQIVSRKTPDNTYICVYWDWICWTGPEVGALEETLSEVRHAFLRVGEDGSIDEDRCSCDSHGIDEEFEQMLSWRADICFWDEDIPLAPEKDYVRMSREDLVYALKTCIHDFIDGLEDWYRYDALSSFLSDEQIRDLGYGDVIPKEKK